MQLPARVEYPIIAVGDRHGRRVARPTATGCGPKGRAPSAQANGLGSESLPGKVQVSGHIHTGAPDANAVRVRIDTSGGMREPLTACVLTGPTAPPEFLFSTR